MQTRIWLTGFEPFGQHEENPSKILVEQLLGTTQIQQLECIPPYGFESDRVELTYSGKILAVDEEGSQASLEHLEHVDAVVHVGLNEKAEKIRFEMCAINELNFRIPDNSGREISEGFVDESGLPLLHTTAHRPSITNWFSGNNAVEISEDCGQFVCNETYYRTLNSIERNGWQSRGRALPAIFVHIPPFEFVPEQQQLEILGELCAHVVQKPVIQVVGGVIINSKHQILACKRAPEQIMAGYWEFPGGKVDSGETQLGALIRELDEELGINIEMATPIDTIIHDYGSMIVHITFFSGSFTGQELNPSVHDECRWVSASEAKSLNWLPADIGFVEHITALGFENL